jgi:hypothetical protein
VGRDERFSRGVLFAWITWAVSLLLPAAGIRADGELFRGDFLLPGWQVAASVLVEPPRSLLDGGRAAAWLMGFTNFIMLASPVTEMTRRRSVRSVFKFLAIGAIHLNAGALIRYGALLSYGYWVWLASFVMLAVTLSRDLSRQDRT